MALVLAAGCKGKDKAQDDALARDVALAASSDGITLAPTTGAQNVVSAEEQSRQARPRVAPSSRASRPSPHRAPHRDRVAAPSQEVAAVADPAPQPQQPSVAIAPASAPSTTDDAGPAPDAPRPHPADVPSTGGGSGGGVSTGRGGGIGIGDVIGIIGGVVLRGGVADGDHCDPRGRHGGGGGGAILINQRIPTGPIMRGRF
jgi:hypothetical protein